MKIASFLVPKAMTTFVYDYNTVRQAMEKMERSGYAEIPVLSKEGKYLYTISTKDLLALFKKDCKLCFMDCELIKISQVERSGQIEALNATVSVDDVLLKAMEQNLIPVVDDYYTYIGLVRRREIIQYLREKAQKVLL